MTKSSEVEKTQQKHLAEHETLQQLRVMEELSELSKLAVIDVQKPFTDLIDQIVYWEQKKVSRTVNAYKALAFSAATIGLPLLTALSPVAIGIFGAVSVLYGWDYYSDNKLLKKSISEEGRFFSFSSRMLKGLIEEEEKSQILSTKDVTKSLEIVSQVKQRVLSSPELTSILTSRLMTDILDKLEVEMFSSEQTLAPLAATNFLAEVKKGVEKISLRDDLSPQDKSLKLMTLILEKYNQAREETKGRLANPAQDLIINPDLLATKSLTKAELNQLANISEEQLAADLLQQQKTREETKRRISNPAQDLIIHPALLAPKLFSKEDQESYIRLSEEDMARSLYEEEQRKKRSDSGGSSSSNKTDDVTPVIMTAAAISTYQADNSSSPSSSSSDCSSSSPSSDCSF